MQLTEDAISADVAPSCTKARPACHYLSLSLWANQPSTRTAETLFQNSVARASLTGTPLQKVNLAGKLQQFSEHWNPKIVGELNGHPAKSAKLEGEFVWHHHAKEDELFLVIKGTLIMRLRDGDVEISSGEFLIVPRGTEHQPYAPEEVHVLLFEPASTLNTGNVVNERTVEKLQTL